MDEKSPRDNRNEAPEPEEDFASLLEREQAGVRPEPRAGQQVTGTVVQVGETEVFVDVGARSELPMAAAELRDAEGRLTCAVGDEVTAYVQQVGDEKRLTLAVDAARLGPDELRRAREDGTPLTGVVRETNKGGFGVQIGGHRAFCPFSQMDLRRIEEPEAWVGRRLRFRVLDIDPRGRNVVVSRRAVLEQERRIAAERTRADLALGKVLTGAVTRLVPFGAFVDIGGVEGLVHVSQIAHERIADPAAVLAVGQEIRVEVIELQNLGEDRHERIGLSMKTLQSDPWPDAVSSLQVGGEARGRIARLVAFGAFVELAPGVEGLIHISELSPGRIRHPADVVEEGQQVVVRVLDLDPQRRRISLSLKDAEQPAD